MRAAELLTTTASGLYCRAGNFYIDPPVAVPRAVITHAHRDHARPGHGAVAATADTLALMQLRYGSGFAQSTQALGYGESLWLEGIRVSLYPAGHVLGSAQVLIEAGNARVVVSGDYKTVPDPTCAAFEPMPCDLFVTEATFALPVFHHGDPGRELRKLLDSMALFANRTHLIGSYAVGKAQRLIALLRDSGYDRPIYLHGALDLSCRYYASRGVALGPLREVRTASRDELAGALVLCPPSALRELWARRFADPVKALASGFMRVRARARQRGVELPLVISDHADWEALTATVTATGAAQIWVTHGREAALVHWCRKQGLAAQALGLQGYGEEDDEGE